jgi:uncharacterized RDD family membrane protein YckC
MNPDPIGTNPSGQASAAQALYATFPRRLNAVSLDTVVLLAFSGILFVGIAPLVETIQPIRVGLVILWWIVLLLYEPLTVWLVGGTVGHRVMNIRVVDNRTGGNVSLLQALGRFVLKVLLGVFSFLTMNFTSRHQAMHDIFTNSSVRIRNPAKAGVYDYTVGKQ